VLGGPLGIGGGAVSLGFWAIVERFVEHGALINSTKAFAIILANYLFLLVSYRLLAIRYRVFGLFAALLHVLEWTIAPLSGPMDLRIL
jgi:hypothetical protein